MNDIRNLNDNQLDAIIKFLKALDMAEETGVHKFICPCCGGAAHWSRNAENNHIFAKCDGCHIVIRE